MYCATIPTGSLPPPSTTVAASAVASAVGSADSSVALPWDASAEVVACGAALSVVVEPFRETTKSAINTTAITTAVTTRFEEELFVVTEDGTPAPGVFAGRLVTEELWKLERFDETGTAGTTKVDDERFAVFFADFLTAFFADFLTADFLTAFFADFLTADFFTTRLTTRLTTGLATDFFAEVFFAGFFAGFFAVFLTATLVLLGL